MDSSQLYELSLAIGSSLDLHESCDRFLGALATIKQLHFTSVWLKNRLLMDADVSFGEAVEESAVLAYAHPRERFLTESIPLDHPVLSWLAEDEACSFAPPDPCFYEAAIEKRQQHGAVALFSLGDLGFLKLYTRYRTAPFTPAEMTELGNLVSKFTISVEGCLAHHRAMREVILRKRAEAAVRHSEEHFRALIENALDIVLVLNYDGSVQFAGPSVQRLLGHEPDSLVDQSLFEFVHPEDLPGILRTFQSQVRVPGVAPPVEFRFRHRDGSWRTLSASTNNLLSLPSVSGIIMNCHDVTERNRTREALFRSEERYSMAVRGANDGIWDWDLTRGELYLSTRWKSILGLEDGELANLPSSWFDRVHPDDRGLLEEKLEEHCRGETDLFEHEYRMLHANGTHRWVLSRGIAVRDEHGEPYRVAGSQTDVTERRRQRLELEEARRLALEASRAKGEFLANMSHEIRTPMNAVIGMASLLQESDLAPQQSDQADVIRSSGEILLAIVNDILDLAKIESGRLEVERAPFRLRHCIESSLDLVSQTAADKGVDLVYWVNDPVPDHLIGDPTRTRQVLVNLLNNAVKFTSEGGVAVTARSRPVDDGRVKIELAVKDSGIGIAPDKLKQLFEPFSQADASTTRRFGGTGLGLAISKRLCELLGGSIRVESTPGIGSTFHFTIVAEIDDSAAAEPQDETLTAALRGARLLLVDDNPDVRRALTVCALGWGAEPHAVATVTEALERLDRPDRYDVMITDSTLPESDLDRLEGEVQARAPDLPVVLLAAGSTGAQAAEGQWAAVVNKPVRPARLAAAVAEVLTGESVLPAEPVPRDDAAMPRPGVRILLAEDNPVNQRVALMMLERLGYTPDIATDGNEVLAAVEQKDYDLILMDVQMPEVDGFELTRRIRDGLGHGAERIIAMTAHALAGDRERCLSAGMDDYLAKPVDLDQLRAALLRSAPAATPAQNPALPEPVTLDRERIAQLRSFAGSNSDELLHALVDAFADEIARHTEAMRDACREENCDELAEAAHALKGSALNLGATAAAELCHAVEEAGNGQCLDGMGELLESLATELERASAELRAEVGGS